MFKYFNSTVNMLENLKDQIHSLRWFKTEGAPAVTNQTLKTGRLLQLPFPEGGRELISQPHCLPYVLSQCTEVISFTLKSVPPVYEE